MSPSPAVQCISRTTAIPPPPVNVRTGTTTVPQQNAVSNVAAAGAAGATNAVSAANVASVALYYVPRRFDKESKLHVYLAHKCPDIISLRKTDYNLYEVLLAFKRIIANEKLYDPQNPTVVMCDESLEDALDVKAIHVSEIREQVCKQFKPILRANPVTNRPQTTVQQLGPSVGGRTISDVPDVPKPVPINPVLSTATQASNLNTSVPAANRPSGVNQNPLPGITLTRSVTAPAATVGSGPASQATVGDQSSDVIALPSWASTTANAVTARVNSAAPFDIEGRYMVKPAFLKVLRSVEGVKQLQVVFPYREVANILSKYIMTNKDKFFDLRNIRVALVENDPLGEAFGVKAFARSQVTALLRSQLIAYTEPQSLSQPDDQAKMGGDALAPKRKRPDVAELSTDDDDDELQSASGAAAGKAAVKRARRRSCDLSITIHLGDASSGEETIYSAQGYETAAICDDDPSDDNSSDDSSLASVENDQFTEENIYRVEYEIDTGSDDNDDGKNKSTLNDSSADDSDIEDVCLIRDAVTNLLNSINSSDFSNWADSDSDTEDDEFALSSYNPELQESDVWKCVNCSQPNTPYMRYCHRCWEERKGWVPERVNPRRRKKEKKREGIELHRSASHPTEKYVPVVQAKNKAVLDGEDDPMDGLVGSRPKETGSTESVISSQSTDSGIDTDSQTDGSQELVGCSGPDSVSSQNSQTRETLIATSSQDCKNDDDCIVIDLDVEQANRKYSDLQSDQRRRELPLSVYEGKRGKVRWVALAPESEADLCSLSSSSSRSTTAPSLNPSQTCTMCCFRPKNACFIHGQISHQVCCYLCAKMIFKKRGTCPVCRRRIEKITKNIVV